MNDAITLQHSVFQQTETLQPEQREQSALLTVDSQKVGPVDLKAMLSRIEATHWTDFLNESASLHWPTTNYRFLISLDSQSHTKRDHSILNTSSTNVHWIAPSPINSEIRQPLFRVLASCGVEGVVLRGILDASDKEKHWYQRRSCSAWTQSSFVSYNQQSNRLASLCFSIGGIDSNHGQELSNDKATLLNLFLLVQALT